MTLRITYNLENFENETIAHIIRGSNVRQDARLHKGAVATLAKLSCNSERQWGGSRQENRPPALKI